MQTTSITVISTDIRQLDGLYSLNDLHKASGGTSKDQPAKFMCLEQTKALLSELSSTDSESLPVKTVVGKGKQQGTYVCRELVYAYAMWISPKFHLAVIRAFDAMHGGNSTVPPAPTSAMPAALALYRESVQALLLTQHMQQAHTLACRSVTRATGVDLEGMWAAPAHSLLYLPPDEHGNPRIAQPVAQRRSMAELKTKIMQVVKDARRYRAASYIGLTRQGVMPYGYALTLCKAPSETFRQAIDEMLAVGLIRQPLDIYTGGMLCFVAGGAK